MKQNKTRSMRSLRDSRNSMRKAFEKYEMELYQGATERLERCEHTGVYLMDEVQVGYVDWRRAWSSAVSHLKQTYQNKNANKSQS